MHWEIIIPNMREVMVAFDRSHFGQRFYLAGGTALALQLGHRKSVDLDFFTPTEDISTIASPLMDSLRTLSPTIADTSWGNLVLVANNVKVGFYGYGYELLAPLIEADDVRMASVFDIGLMKMDALLSRASRKDFYDLYTICQNIPLQELLKLAPRKFPGVRDFESQVVRHMVYFERAEQEADVPMLISTSWGEVKSWFQQQAVSLGRSWLKD
jgi:predicted nucleotidyltransferase component of viral defense system